MTLWKGIRSGEAFAGSASRYYRSNTAGAYINDNFKLRSNLTMTGGVRWDFDGPLSEKYGKLTGFDPNRYAYNVATDTITGSGLEIAGNNPNHTPGASNSLMNQRQWGFAPRIGIAWTPNSETDRARGLRHVLRSRRTVQLLLGGAGSGFNGPFGVTLAPPFVEPDAAHGGVPFRALRHTPSRRPPPALPVFSPVAQPVTNRVRILPAGNLFGPFLFGGYDINNKLPYTQNWTLDLQYQLSNNWLFEVAYVGNHGPHEVLPVPFNQPLLATPSHPVNDQMYSYGGLSQYSVCNTYYNGYTPLDDEPLCPPPYYSGNAEVRVPYIGYDYNSVTYKAEGISNYNALQVQARKRLSNGLQFTALHLVACSG